MAMQVAQAEFHVVLAQVKVAFNQELFNDDTQGSVNMSTRAILIFPGVAAPGTVSITSSGLYLEMNEKDLEFWSLDLSCAAAITCMGSGTFQRSVLSSLAVTFCRTRQLSCASPVINLHHVCLPRHGCRHLSN